MEKGTLDPKDVAALGYSMDDFRARAPEIYIDGKNAQIAGFGKITDERAFLASTPKQKEAISTSLSDIQEIKNSLVEYKKLVQEHGGELTGSTKAGAELERLKNAIALKLKNVADL